MAKNQIFYHSEIKQNSYIEKTVSIIEETLDQIIEIKSLEVNNRLEIPIIYDIFELANSVLRRIDKKFEDPFPIYKQAAEIWDGREGLADLILRNSNKKSILDFVTTKINPLSSMAKQAQICIECMLHIDSNHDNDELVKKWREIFLYSGKEGSEEVNMFIVFLEQINQLNSLNCQSAVIEGMSGSSFFAKKSEEIFACVTEAIQRKIVKNAIDKWNNIVQLFDKSPGKTMSIAFLNSFVSMFSRIEETEKTALTCSGDLQAKSFEIVENFYKELISVLEDNEISFVVALSETERNIAKRTLTSIDVLFNDEETNIIEKNAYASISIDQGFEIRCILNSDSQIIDSENMFIEEKGIAFFEINNYADFISKVSKLTDNEKHISISFDCLIFENFKLNKYKKIIFIHLLKHDGSFFDIKMLTKKDFIKKHVNSVILAN